MLNRINWLLFVCVCIYRSLQYSKGLCDSSKMSPLAGSSAARMVTSGRDDRTVIPDTGDNAGQGQAD